MRIFVAATFAVMFVASAMGATLPLEGYCRVGKYMPVITSEDVKGSGILPVRMVGGAERVAPVLVLAETASLEAPAPKLHVLGDDERLVGLVGAATEAHAKALFPDQKVVTTKLSWPLARPLFAWQTLDGVLIADSATPDGETVATFLASGAVIAVKAPRSPEQGWTWRQRAEGWWELKSDLPPLSWPRIDPSVLLSSWPTNTSAHLRRNVVLMAIIFSAVVLAMTLRPGRLTQLALACVVLGASVAIGLWSLKQPTGQTAVGLVQIDSGDFLVNDFWYGDRSLRSGTRQSLMGDKLFPLVKSDDVERLKMELVSPSDDGHWKYQWIGDKGEGVVFAYRGLLRSRSGTTLMFPEGNATLRLILHDVYPGYRVLSEQAGPSGDADWGYVKLKYAKKETDH